MAERANDPSGKQLLAYIQRIERLETEKADIAADVKEVYTEAKGNGYTPKIIRKIVAKRKRDADEVAEEEALQELYEHSIGMHPDEGEDE